MNSRHGRPPGRREKFPVVDVSDVHRSHGKFLVGLLRRRPRAPVWRSNFGRPTPSTRRCSRNLTHWLIPHRRARRARAAHGGLAEARPGTYLACCSIHVGFLCPYRLVKLLTRCTQACPSPGVETSPWYRTKIRLG